MEYTDFNEDQFEELENIDDLRRNIRKYRQAIKKGKLHLHSLPSEDTFISMIDYCLSNRKYKDALEFSNVFAQTSPYSTEAWLRKGVSESAMFLYPEAIESFERALALNPFDTEVKIQKAMTLSFINSNKKALSLLDEVLGLEPGNEEALFNKGVILEGMMKYKEATTIFEFLKESEFYHKDACQELAYCHHYLKDYDTSIQYYKEALDDDPYDHYLWYNLGVVFSQKEYYYKSIDCFEYVISLKEKFFPALHNLANSYAAIGRLGEAIYYFRKAEKISPKDIENMFNLASVLGDNAEYEAAIEYFTKVIDKQKEYYQAYFGRGVCYDAMDMFDKALDDYDIALSYNTQNPELWYAKADLLYNKDNLEEAVQCYKKVIEIEPNNIDGWFDCAQTLYELKKYDEAEEAFSQLLNIAPGWADVHYFLAKVLAHRNNVAESIKHLKISFMLEPNKEKEFQTEFPTIVTKRNFENYLPALDYK